MRFDRSRIDEAIRVAQVVALSRGGLIYVFATARGYVVEERRPATDIDYIEVSGCTVTRFEYDLRKGEYNLTKQTNHI